MKWKAELSCQNFDRMNLAPLRDGLKGGHYANRGWMAPPYRQGQGVLEAEAPRISCRG